MLLSVVFLAALLVRTVKSSLFFSLSHLFESFFFAAIEVKGRALL
jgi:hypothetical protein